MHATRIFVKPAIIRAELAYCIALVPDPTLMTGYLEDFVRDLTVYVGNWL